jgi:hypothetical protein
MSLSGSKPDLSDSEALVSAAAAGIEDPTAGFGVSLSLAPAPANQQVCGKR